MAPGKSEEIIPASTEWIPLPLNGRSSGRQFSIKLQKVSSLPEKPSGKKRKRPWGRQNSVQILSVQILFKFSLDTPAPAEYHSISQKTGFLLVHFSGAKI